MQDYESKQRAWWVMLPAAALAVAGVWLLLRFGLANEGYVGGALLVAAFSLASFGSLTVRVSSEEVRWFFGLGLPGRRLPIESLRGVEARRSPWYWGWGIRWTPRGWLWRSTGLDAVWLELANGKRIGVGTPDPDGLANAIRERLGPT